MAAHWGDDIRWCIDTFGPTRCMFESNFPVDRGLIGYAELWNAFQKIAAIQDRNSQERNGPGLSRCYRRHGFPKTHTIAQRRGKGVS